MERAYDRKLSDALSVQREIAAEISARLRERLTGEQRAKLSNGGTSDPEAYQLYSRVAITGISARRKL